jgi:hypothetical protein
MAEETNLSHRLRFAAPEVRSRLGLPAYHLENGVGGPVGHAPGFAYAPQPIHDRTHPRANDPGKQAYADYVQRLSEAWKHRR